MLLQEKIKYLCGNSTTDTGVDVNIDVGISTISLDDSKNCSKKFWVYSTKIVSPIVKKIGKTGKSEVISGVVI